MSESAGNNTCVSACKVITSRYFILDRGICDGWLKTSIIDLCVRLQSMVG